LDVLLIILAKGWFRKLSLCSDKLKNPRSTTTLSRWNLIVNLITQLRYKYFSLDAELRKPNAIGPPGCAIKECHGSGGWRLEVDAGDGTARKTHAKKPGMGAPAKSDANARPSAL
jgi:hypothetical protein